MASDLRDMKDTEARLRRVRALVLDVDGVLTDGRVLVLPDGTEVKSFYARDGLGIQLMKASGLKTAVISGRKSEVVEQRSRELGIDLVLQGVGDKVEAFEKVLKDLELTDESVAYVGDDLPDIAIFERAGVGFAVADAVPEVRQKAHVVLRSGGGQGAVREACELILKSRGAWRV